jgi:hypothetical protein
VEDWKRLPFPFTETSYIIQDSSNRDFIACLIATPFCHPATAMNATNNFTPKSGTNEYT